MPRLPPVLATTVKGSTTITIVGTGRGGSCPSMPIERSSPADGRSCIPDPVPKEGTGRGLCNHIQFSFPTLLMDLCNVEWMSCLHVLHFSFINQQEHATLERKDRRVCFRPKPSKAQERKKRKLQGSTIQSTLHGRNG